MIIKNCNVGKLHNEFIKKGINPYPVFVLENGDGDFTFTEDTDMELVRQIIDKHDPTPAQPDPTETELVMLAIADLDMQREQDKIETQLAIAELAETLLGGVE